jgi:hypothetical protein
MQLWPASPLVVDSPSVIETICILLVVGHQLEETVAFLKDKQQHRMSNAVPESTAKCAIKGAENLAGSITRCRRIALLARLALLLLGTARRARYLEYDR